MSTTAFPLVWPENWPRTPYHKRETSHRFGGRVYSLTFDHARQQLLEELGRLHARNIVLSTNVPLRQDGQPYAGAATARLNDPGVAVYFTLKGQPRAMARDGFTNIAANMRSLFLAIEGLRQMERHGGSYMMERAFSGFAALPAPDSKKPWREVFGVKPEWKGDIGALFREKARARHPDSGGDHTLMAELNVAYTEAKRELGTP